MLDLERLRVLHAVGTTGSVTAAARTLHVTGSAVSQQLARLEREVGQSLVERQGRGVRLTDAGQLLVREAGELLTHVERVETRLAEHRGAIVGTLTVAAFATAMRGLLPNVLCDLRSRHPDLSMSLVEQEPHEAIPALRRGQLDIVIVQDWVDDELAEPDELSRCDLIDDTFDLAVPVGHPLAGRTSVALTELVDEDWIGWTATEICHDWLISTLRNAGARPRIVHTASEHATQLALVAAGLGVALIPRLGRDPAPPSVAFVPVTEAPVRRIFALWRTSTTARPALRAMLDALTRGETGAR